MYIRIIAILLILLMPQVQANNTTCQTVFVIDNVVHIVDINCDTEEQAKKDIIDEGNKYLKKLEEE